MCFFAERPHNLGEVAKGYPFEDFSFDEILKSDIEKAWEVSTEVQAGEASPSERTPATHEDASRELLGIANTIVIRGGDWKSANVVD